jgi:hypothetical protein
MGNSWRKLHLVRRVDPTSPTDPLSPTAFVNILVNTAIKKHTIHFKLHAESSVVQLKESIRDSEGIPVPQKRLTASDIKQPMLDEKMIQDYFPKFDYVNQQWFLVVNMWLRL